VVKELDTKLENNVLSSRGHTRNRGRHNLDTGGILRDNISPELKRRSMRDEREERSMQLDHEASPQNQFDMLIPLLSCVPSYVSNKNAASFISVHHHYGDNTLQLRGIHASEQPTENYSLQPITEREHTLSLSSSMSKRSRFMVKVWV
jgi:hypothetical protein